MPGKNKNKKSLLIKIAAASTVLIVFVATVILCNISFSQPTPKISHEATLTTSQPLTEIKPIEARPINLTLTDPNAPKSTALPILMYHFFYDPARGETGGDNNWLDVKTFEDQIKYLTDNNYYFPNWDEVKQYVAGQLSLPEKSIVLTDDDGSSSFFDLAVPILTKYKVPVTSFVITSWTDPKTINTDKNLVTFMSHSHDMHQAGCEGGHGGLFRCLDHDKAIADLTTSRNMIGGGDVFCYPFGDYTDQAIQELKEAGFALAVTTEYGKAMIGSDPLLLPRIRISKTTDLASFISTIQ